MSETQSQSECNSPVVSMRFRNAIKDNPFDFTLKVAFCPKTSLFSYMQTGSNENPTLLQTFTCTYYPSVPGFFIDAINKVFGIYSQDKTYWEIFVNGKPADKGVCDLYPVPKEEVMFDLVKVKVEDKTDGAVCGGAPGERSFALAFHTSME